MSPFKPGGRRRASKLRLLLLVPLLAGLWLVSDGLYIKAKAVAAQVLLERAWEKAVRTGRPAKAWSWADTWPVARLRVPRLGIDLVVLEGVSGEALAFGPGRYPGLGSEAGSSTTLIAAHKDTHFRFLPRLETGDEILFESMDGHSERFVVIGFEILDYREATLAEDPLLPKLLLVTCYPFDRMVVGGPLRYVVIAERSISPAAGAAS